MSTFQETIRVAPLVRKFLSVHYDTAPFRLVFSRDPFSAFLLNSLDFYPSARVLREYEALPDKLDVSLTHSQVRWHDDKNCFNQQKLLQFNAFVQQYFLQQATREMVVRVETGEKIIRAAELILARYKLTEDDLSIDTLMRYYRAYKDTINGRVKAAW